MNPTLALEADADAIATLVNAAYRSLPRQAGWTHEGHLVAGPRIEAEKVRSLIRDGATILLLRDGERVLASVQLEPEDDAAYIGLFATDPAMQGQGLGKQLLAHAESHAVRQLGSRWLRMAVMSGRPELLAFYERRGYQRTGETMNYPPPGEEGEPRVAGLHLIWLEKPAA